METMEQNRQIVQEGLDRSASKRKKAIVEAEQEIITVQMFRIVNANAYDAAARQKIADAKQQFARNQVEVTKANNRRNKKIAIIKKQRKAIIINEIASMFLLAIAVAFYLTGVTEMLTAAVVFALSMFLFIFNLCLFVKAQKKLKGR